MVSQAIVGQRVLQANLENRAFRERLVQGGLLASKETQENL